MRFAAGLLAAAALLAGGCNDDGGRRAADGGRPRVVASFYPLYEAVARVGGDRVEAVNLTPAGTEPHDLELTADQVADLEDADVVVVLGGGFQPAVEEVARRRHEGTIDVLAELGARGRAGGRRGDPHVWLDPVQMAAVVDRVADGLAAADAAGAGAYRAAAAAFRRDLEALNERYRATLSTCDRRLVVTGHQSFGHLAARYGLDQEGITGLSPEAEPDPRRIDELAEQVRASGATTVFTEELLPADVAEALAREAGATVAVLDTLESLSGEKLGAGAGYVSVMEENLAALAAALGCRG